MILRLVESDSSDGIKEDLRHECREEVRICMTQLFSLSLKSELKYFVFFSLKL